MFQWELKTGDVHMGGHVTGVKNNIRFTSEYMKRVQQHFLSEIFCVCIFQFLEKMGFNTDLCCVKKLLSSHIEEAILSKKSGQEMNLYANFIASVLDKCNKLVR